MQDAQGFFFLRVAPLLTLSSSESAFYRSANRHDGQARRSIERRLCAASSWTMYGYSFVSEREQDLVCGLLKPLSSMSEGRHVICFGFSRSTAGPGGFLHIAMPAFENRKRRR
jgi:hypothetical protein